MIASRIKNLSLGLSLVLGSLLGASKSYAAQFPLFCQDNPFFFLNKFAVMDIIKTGSNPEICTFSNGFLNRYDLRDLTLAGPVQLVINSTGVSASDLTELAAHGASIVIPNYFIPPAYNVTQLTAIAQQGKVKIYLDGTQSYYRGWLSALAKAGVELNILSGVNGYAFFELLDAAKQGGKITLYVNSNLYNASQLVALAQAGIRVLP